MVHHQHPQGPVNIHLPPPRLSTRQSGRSQGNGERTPPTYLALARDWKGAVCITDIKLSVLSKIRELLYQNLSMVRL